MAVEPMQVSCVEVQAQDLVDSLRSKDGWRSAHGHIQRAVIVRDGEDAIQARRIYERAYDILLEQGYAVRFHFGPHGDDLVPTGYVEMSISIGR